MIPYGHQSIDENDIAAVMEVLNSDWLTQGPTIERFERAVAEYCGVQHAVAVANGTAALHVACLGLGLDEGSTLWTSPNTFVASANCAYYCGASVDFVDIDPATLNMSVDALEEKLEQAARQGSLPTLVVPVHFGGLSCEMQRIGELAQKYGFMVLEDASHAIGGSYRGEVVGSLEHSVGATFSFHPVKLITSAEGGMVVTNDSEFAARMRMFRTHGIVRDSASMRRPSQGAWYWEQVALGYNYRLTDIQAALGLSQLSRLDRFVERRNELAERYDQLLAALPLTAQARQADTVSAFHLYVVKLDEDCARTRHDVFTDLRDAGVGVNVHYIPVHTQPYYLDRGFSHGDFPNAEAYYERALTLPLFPAMTEEQQDFVVRALEEATSR